MFSLSVSVPEKNVLVEECRCRNLPGLESETVKVLTSRLRDHHTVAGEPVPDFLERLTDFTGKRHRRWTGDTRAALPPTPLPMLPLGAGEKKKRSRRSEVAAGSLPLGLGKKKNRPTTEAVAAPAASISLMSRSSQVLPLQFPALNAEIEDTNKRVRRPSAKCR